jgi:hypothetical protein
VEQPSRNAFHVDGVHRMRSYQTLFHLKNLFRVNNEQTFKEKTKDRIMKSLKKKQMWDLTEREVSKNQNKRIRKILVTGLSSVMSHCGTPFIDKIPEESGRDQGLKLAEERPFRLCWNRLSSRRSLFRPAEWLAE